MSESWIRPVGQQSQLFIYVQPGASRSELVGTFGEPQRLKFKIKAPPRDGEANSEVLVFVSQLLGISKGRIEILRGESSRQKDLLIDLPYEKAIILLRELLR